MKTSWLWPTGTALVLTCIVFWATSACGLLNQSSPTPVPATATPSPTALPVPADASPSAQTLVVQVIVAEVGLDLPAYSREDWRHWRDADGDCQDARQEVLIAESQIEVVFEDERRCRVASGRWIGPYTGTVVEDPGALDIDHMVPLANAHRSGGWQWSEERKSDFANSLKYPGHLIATTAGANRAKGAKGPEEWRPDDRGYWCQYALDWIAIKSEWGLTAIPEELDALEEMVATCDPMVYIQTETLSEAPQAPDVTHLTSTPTPHPSPPAPPSPAPTAIPRIEDRDCSDFDSWAEAQRFFEDAGGPNQDPHRLDRDGNGVACQSLPGAP